MTRSTAAAAVALAFFLIFVTTASASGPTISYSITGIAGNNGWYRGSTNGDNVILHWSVSTDATSTNCLAAVPVPGDTAGTTQTCWATSIGGTTTAVTGQLKIDATPPTGVTANFSRGPDYHGWYNHPVTIGWSGTDATSGIAGCSSVTYGGPANGAATVNGGCTDMAGNSAGSTAHLAYDATPPVLSEVSERSTATADNSSGARRAPPTASSSSAPSVAAKDIRLCSTAAPASSMTARSTPARSTSTPCSPRRGRERLERRLHRRPAESPDAAEDALCAAGGAEPDPPLATRPWCRLLQRAAVPRLEAHLRRVAEDAPGRPAADLEMVRPPLPADAWSVPLVRLGRLRPPHIGAVPHRRQRALRRSAPLGSSVLHPHRLCT